MIYSVSGNSISNLQSHSNSSNKIEVPLPSSLSVYAQFKYVRGIPANSGQEPMSISKAKVIDNMVSFLNSPPRNANLNPNEEYTVRELETEVHRVVNDDKKVFNSLPGKGVDTGIIFNITA